MAVRKKAISKPEITTMPEKVYKCTCCGLEHRGDAKKYFFPSFSKIYQHNDGYVTICKNCCKQMFKDYYQEYGNEVQAVYRMCMMLDMYYDPSIIDSATKSNISSGSLFSSYLMQVFRNQFKNKTFDDSIRAEDLIIGTQADLDKVNEEKITLSPATVEFFGVGYKESEYKYLQQEYNEWVTRYECSTKAQEEIFKILSITQLKIRNAGVMGIQKDLDNATKSFQDLLGTANLQPKQMRNNAMVEANTLGTLIEKWEDDNPIPDPDPELTDVDGIKKYITVWFFGHMCHMLGIKNDAAALYESEKAKYTVKLSETVEDDENVDIANILKSAMNSEGGDSNGQ